MWFLKQAFGNVFVFLRRVMPTSELVDKSSHPFCFLKCVVQQVQRLPKVFVSFLVRSSVESGAGIYLVCFTLLLFMFRNGFSCIGLPESPFYCSPWCPAFSLLDVHSDLLSIFLSFLLCFKLLFLILFWWM